MNPYAQFLEDREPMEVLAATPVALRKLVDEIGPTKVNQPPGPKKWSVREILCHLADTEVVMAYRLRQILAEPHHVIQPFDQDLFALQYEAYQADPALQAFTAVRTWTLSLLRAVPGDAWSKPVTHPERGEMTFRLVVETLAGHDLNHVRQIEALTAHPAFA